MAVVRDYLVITAVFLGLVFLAMGLSWPAWKAVEAYPGNEALYWVAVVWTCLAYAVTGFVAMQLLTLYRHRITSDGRRKNS
jgi:hypothetical protein